MTRFRLITLISTIALITSGCVQIGSFNRKVNHSPAQPEAVEITDVVEVTASRLNLRDCPSTRCSIEAQLPRRTQLYILEKKGKNWLKVEQIDDRLIGWVSARYVQLLKEQLTPSDHKGENQESGELLSDDELMTDEVQEQQSVVQSTEPPISTETDQVSPKKNTTGDTPAGTQGTEDEFSTDPIGTESAAAKQPDTSGEESTVSASNLLKPPEQAPTNSQVTKPPVDTEPQAAEEVDPGISDEFM